jgi:ribonuclease HI
MMIGYFDGASRGNPGEAGAGACIVDFGKGQILWKESKYLGKRTNNEAEYEALILLLRELLNRKLYNCVVKGDSKLVVNQMLGNWKIREPRLLPLAEEALFLIDKTKARLQWIPRQENSLADNLSNKAIDESKRVGGETDEHADKLVSRMVSDHIYIVKDGQEEFVVDLKHNNCSCPDFRTKGHCAHMDEVAKGRKKTKA